MTGLSTSCVVDRHTRQTAKQRRRHEGHTLSCFGQRSMSEVWAQIGGLEVKQQHELMRRKNWVMEMRNLYWCSFFYVDCEITFIRVRLKYKKSVEEMIYIIQLFTVCTNSHAFLHICLRVGVCNWIPHNTLKIHLNSMINWRKVVWLYWENLKYSFCDGTSFPIILCALLWMCLLCICSSLCY